MKNSGYYSNRAAVIIITHEEGNISSSLTSGVFEAREKIHRTYISNSKRKGRNDVFWREGRPLPASPFAWSSSLLLSFPPSFSFSSSSSSSSYNNSSSSS